MNRVLLLIGALILVWLPSIPAAAASPYTIVFVEDLPSHVLDDHIATISGDGAGLTRLTGAFPGSNIAPVWSPDGTKIAFSSSRDHSFRGQGCCNDLYIMNADGTNVTQITTDPSYVETDPAWSPDGAKLAFEMKLDLHVVNTDGTGLTQLTFDGTSTWDGKPSWSPDGTEIVFSSGTNIDVISSNGTNRRSIITGADPDWSPDGTRIVFIQNQTMSRPVFTMKPDGTEVTRLTMSDAWHDAPAWCPDGKAITYVSQETGDMHVYLMDADGGSPTQVTTTGVVNSAPDCFGFAVAGNNPPVAVDDAESVDNGGKVVIDPIANDYDPDGDAIPEGTITSGPFHGAVTLNPDGTLTYTHDGTATTSDWFDYHVTDGFLDSNTARVHMTITAVLGPPEGPVRVGLVDTSSGMWRLLDFNWQEFSFYFGDPGDVPFMGDWDCDGIDTPGLFRQSDAFAYLRNSNTEGVADIRFYFGNPSDIPLAGDFDGDGCDSLSIYRPSEQRFYIMNKLGENEGGLGAADYAFYFGNPGDKPVVGDWDGDGIDEVGLHRETTGLFYYRNTNTTGIADAEFIFGDPGDRFVGDDFGIYDGVATPAVFRPGATTFYFRYTLTAGHADGVWFWGNSPWMPVAGIFE